MGYAAHYRVSLEGIIGTAALPVEIFSTSFSLSATLAQAPPNWEQAVADRIISFWGTGAAEVGGTAILKRVKFSLKATTGLDAAQPVIVNAPGMGKLGGSDSQSLPITCATVLSLNSAGDTRHAKGRMYLPAPTVSVDPSTGFFTANGTGGQATGWAGLFRGVQTDSGEVVVVASKTDGNHAVTHLRSGNVPGNIRRRKNKLHETYNIATL